MKAKFQIGDKVRLTNRTPLYIQSELIRRRTRTIVGARYNAHDQCVYYELGTNEGSYSSTRYGMVFRSYMLNPVNGQGYIIGRPRLKRKYNHHTKLPATPPNQQETAFSAEAIANYSANQNFNSSASINIRGI